MKMTMRDGSVSVTTKHGVIIKSENQKFSEQALLSKIEEMAQTIKDHQDETQELIKMIKDNHEESRQQ